MAMQIIKRHNVDEAVKILFDHAGPQFKEQVIKWGAVHADQRRCNNFPRLSPSYVSRWPCT